MKKLIFILSLSFLTLFAVAQKKYDGQKFGAAIKPGKLVTTATIASTMGKLDSADMKLTGKVLEVCAKKGCFMMLETPSGDPMRVTFKDYAFFMPKDIAGKRVVLQGFAKKSTTSVKTLRHYAKDANRSEEEIAKIINPKNELAFEADGVVILDK